MCSIYTNRILIHIYKDWNGCVHLIRKCFLSSLNEIRCIKVMLILVCKYCIYIYRVIGKKSYIRYLCLKPKRGWVKIAQSCPTLFDLMDYSTPGLPVHHQLLELTQLMFIESMMPSNHLILSCPLLLLPSVFASIIYQ